MTRISPASMLRFVALLLLLAGLHACQLSKEEEVRNTLTFTALFDSLKVYDTVQIEVRTAEGEILDIIYRGRVDSVSELRGLEAPHWDGGRIKIVILGFKGSDAEPVLKVEKSYDGSSRRTEATVVLAHPDARLSASGREIRMTAGESIPLPAVEFHPSDLADRSLNWSSSNPSVAQPAESRLTALTAGSAVVTARMGYDTTRSLDFQVTVSADPGIAEIVSLDRDTLHLAENGAIDGFIVNVTPATASADLAWTVEDPGIAAHAQGDSFQGKKPGITKVRVASKTRPAVSDSAVIVVSGPIPVVSVRFKVRSIDLYVGGATRPLEIEVLPAKANQTVLLAVLDSSKATFEGSRLSPKSEGSTRVVVQSAENPLLSDTLAVTVLPQAVPVEAVDVAEKAVLLYRGGPGKTLTATVTPANAPPQVEWRSLTPSVATVSSLGEIRPVSAGLSLVLAVSAADSTKKDTVEVSVKVDAPVLSVGRDTVVSADQRVVFIVQAAQEYGEIVHFSWDLDGDGIPEDSSNGLVSPAFQYVVPKAYDAAFLVKDTEGNVVKATRRVTVVKSAAVVILEPADNTYTNKNIVKVRWSVDGVEQTAGLSDTLKNHGANTISRTGRDVAGKEFTASITVHLDTVPPLAPVVNGASPTNTVPRWTWSSGGNGGSGTFRFRLGDGAFPAESSGSPDTSYSLAEVPVSGTTYTLYVQERDAAGNWSGVGSHGVLFDVTQPVVSIAAPRASGIHYTYAGSVGVSGTSDGPLPIVRVAYKAGSAAAVNATFTDGAWSTPALVLQEGVPLLVTVTAYDNAGNSGEAAVTLFLDATPPSAPTFTVGPGASVDELKASFGWTAGADGPNGSGFNGRYRYNLNGGPWKDTTGMQLADLALVEGTNTFSVQQQDRALNWSASATRIVKADITGPVLTLTSHANPANIGTFTVVLAGQVRDTGTGVASMSVSGQASGNGAVTVTGTSWSTSSLTLANGRNSLVLTAIDNVGNSRTLEAILTVNIPAPVVAITHPANNSMLTRNDTIYVHFTIDGASGRQSFQLSEGSNSLVVASNPNASGNIGRDTVMVTRDATPPLSPTLTRGSTPTNGTATWTWTSQGDNPGGAGMRSPPQFRYQVNGGSWNLTNTARLDITAEGSHTVVVQEQDRAGNWSSSSSAQTMVVDKTGPAVAILTRNNFITNRNSASIRFTVDGLEATPSSCALSTANGGQNSCQVSASDALGNRTTASITVWYRPNTWFVKKRGSGQGTSWEDASSDLAGLVSDWSRANFEVWVATGDYGDIYPSTSVKILGGFDSSANSHNLSGRDNARTRIAFAQFDFTGSGSIEMFTIAGLKVRIANMTANNLAFQSASSHLHAIEVVDGGDLQANSIFINAQSYQGSIVAIWGSSATFNGGSVTGNQAGSEGYGISLGGFEASLRLTGGMNLYGNSSPIGYGQIEISGESQLIVDVGVNLICSEIIKNGGTGTCKGNPF